MHSFFQTRFFSKVANCRTRHLCTFPLLQELSLFPEVNAFGIRFNSPDSRKLIHPKLCGSLRFPPFLLSITDMPTNDHIRTRAPRRPKKSSEFSLSRKTRTYAVPITPTLKVERYCFIVLDNARAFPSRCIMEPEYFRLTNFQSIPLFSFSDNFCYSLEWCSRLPPIVYVELPRIPVETKIRFRIPPRTLVTLFDPVPPGPSHCPVPLPFFNSLPYGH